MAYRTLLRYATSQGIRYGAWFSFFLFGVLGAIGERAFTTILSPRYGDAAPWLMAMLLWGALRWATWLPDRMLAAAGRPWLIVLLASIEQAIRIGGGLVLVRVWGAPGLVAAYGAGLLFRATLARRLAGRALVQARIYIWQVLIAPAGGAILTYQMLRIVLIYLWPATASSATWGGGALLAVGLLLPSLWIYGFLTALLGGWDDGVLAELQEATAISSIGFPAAWVLVQSIRLGARISPLHGRYPIALYALAQDEAHALTLAQRQAETIIDTERSA